MDSSFWYFPFGFYICIYDLIALFFSFRDLLFSTPFISSGTFNTHIPLLWKYLAFSHTLHHYPLLIVDLEGASSPFGEPSLSAFHSFNAQPQRSFHSQTFRLRVLSITITFLYLIFCYKLSLPFVSFFLFDASKRDLSLHSYDAYLILTWFNYVSLTGIPNRKVSSNNYIEPLCNLICGLMNTDAPTTGIRRTSPIFTRNPSDSGSGGGFRREKA